MSGNELARQVMWRGESDLGHPDGQAVTLRFRLRVAELFSIRFA